MDGDELYADITNGKLNPGTGEGTATFVWMGGTGRFAAASGEAEMNLVQGPFSPTGAFEFQFSLVGQIDF